MFGRSGECLEGVWKESGGCLEGDWKLSGWHLGNVAEGSWKVFGRSG